jgi:sirohydrochlorin cobaltochelatase
VTVLGFDDDRAFALLDFRMRVLLPAQYQDSTDEVQPVPMRSAGLKFGSDGRVAWDEIWQSFCDLAMAGGPPHKGTLLEPGQPEAIAAALERYREVVDEICRGVTMASELQATDSPVPGRVRVRCFSDTMADWLLRAITMENVAVTRAGEMDLDLPAAPQFRLDKEIKNVVTVIAKTTHYWMGHLARVHKADIGGLFALLSRELPLLEPELADGPETATTRRAAAAAVAQRSGLQAVDHHYQGWMGLAIPSVGEAVWMMRALVAANVLARREGETLFVPINATADPAGELLATRVALVHRLAVRRPRR